MHHYNKIKNKKSNLVSFMCIVSCIFVLTMQMNSAFALHKFGSAAKDAVPALTEALKDEHEFVRDAAQKALKKIKAEK